MTVNPIMTELSATTSYFFKKCFFLWESSITFPKQKNDILTCSCHWKPELFDSEKRRLKSLQNSLL